MYSPCLQLSRVYLLILSRFAYLWQGIAVHVQYTQTNTIRQTGGPLVPMVRLVPIETGVNAMVLLLNMHLIKGT